LLGQIGVVALLSILSTGERGPVIEPWGATHVVLRCPDTAALCSWSQIDGWKPFWTPPDGVPLRDFAAISGGRWVALAQGHMGSGRLYVLGPSAKILAVQYMLDGGRRLSEVSGERRTGELVLCNGPSDKIFCNFWIPASSESQVAFPEMPQPCASPRFLPDGIAICLDDTENSVLRIQNGDGWSRVAVQGPALPAVTDYYPLSRESFVLLRGNEIAVQSAERTRRVDSGVVLWFANRGAKILFSDCQTVVPHLGGCALREFASGAEVRLLWASGPLVVSDLVVLNDQRFLVYLWDESKAVRLMLLQKKGVSWEATALWQRQ